MIKKLQIALLLLVPLVFLVMGLRFDRTKYGTDPESAYLMNGLNIAMGKSVGHYDNPGTTVQMYSAVVLRITYAFRSTDNDLQTDVLKNSEYYIEVLRKGLIIMNACVLLILGLVAFVLLGNFWTGLILQLAPFMSVTLIEECFTKVAPEPVLFATIGALIIILMKFYTSKDATGKKYPLLLGLLAGFGLATKMTFLPVLIIPMIILAGKRNKWIYAFSVIPSFILFTLPAAKGYLSMANWFLSLGTHTGTYGQGNSGLLDPAQYFHSILSIGVNNMAMLAVMGVAVIVLISAGIRARKLNVGDSKKEFYILLALLFTQFGSILLVAKHYHSNHYLFPALSLSGLVLVFSYLLISKNFKSGNKLISKFSMPIVAVLVIGISALNIPYLTLAFNGYRASNQSTDETFSRLDRDFKGYAKVYYYPISFNEYSSLRWGNVYSRQYSTEKLIALFPEGLFYNAGEKSFQLWETSISTREFVKRYGNRILLIGGPLTDDEFKNVELGGLKLKRLFDSRVQVVYEVETEKSELFKGVTHSSPAVWSLLNTFEVLSPDGQWIMSDNGNKFCKNSSLSTDKARSGSHAFKLPVHDTYAMDFGLQDVKPGDTFEISIWKTANSPEAYLVAAKNDGNGPPFYIQSKGFVETDSSGNWEKVILTVVIPMDFSGAKLKVYLWNYGDQPVWFDDFEITRY